jgi:hypothetical protein
MTLATVDAVVGRQPALCCCGVSMPVGLCFYQLYQSQRAGLDGHPYAALIFYRPGARAPSAHRRAGYVRLMPVILMRTFVVDLKEVN